MPRRRDRTPDNRLDWRDPDMPVLRAMDPGMEELSPESESAYSQDVMERALSPEWHDDPSYNWARKARLERKRRIKKYYDRS